MSKHLLEKRKVTRVFGVPAVLISGKATFSLAEPDARIGMLVAARGRRGLEVDHAAATITVGVLTPRARRAPTIAVVSVLLVVLGFSFSQPSTKIRQTSHCSEPVQVGKPMPEITVIQSSYLGGVRTVSYTAACSKDKLRATVDTVTRRVLSVVSG